MSCNYFIFLFSENVMYIENRDPIVQLASEILFCLLNQATADLDSSPSN